MAKEHVRAYVKLLPEPTTIEGVKLAVIALSVVSLGEVTGRRAHRRPPVELEVLKKLVQ